MITHSLSARLSISAGFVLAAFFYLVAFVIEQSYRESAEHALKEKLQVHIYSLLSVAELTDFGILKMPHTLLEPRFSNPGSGLYATIRQIDNIPLWRSSSSLGVDMPSSGRLKPGETLFFRQTNGLFSLNYAVIWENESGLEHYYVFTVAEDESFLSNQIESFRMTLRGWLLFIGCLLLLFQILFLRWSLKPLRDIGSDLEQIESGKKQRLDGVYPKELKRLTDNLNALIASERAHMERYRNTLADLAHSLKTPLAILTGCSEFDSVNKRTVNEQIQRMNEIVEYQLQKAAAKGQRKLTSRVELSSLVAKIISSLNKVYSEKQIDFKFILKKSVDIYCEEGDFFEIAGNLLDNAAKWCRKSVRVSLNELDDDTFSVMLQIEDDGPGIPEHKLREIFDRGVRADENIQGHGIGMAVVNELIDLLGGKLVAGRSDALGGMQWQVFFP